jgi:hypothetical protein
MMTECAAEIEDRRIVAKRLFDALCAAYPDKYITLIQPRDVAGVPAPDVTAAETEWLRKVALDRERPREVPGTR